MITETQKFVSEQTQDLAARARKFGKGSVKSARAVVEDSAEGLKQLKSPVRAIARAGVKLAAVSQTAVTNLIELESRMLTDALTDVSSRLTKVAHADNVVDLVRDQATTLRSTGERIVGDATRAVEIVTDAGQDIRKLATHTYKSVVTAGEGTPAKRKAKAKAKTTAKAKTRVKAKRAVRKSAAAKPVARKAVVRRRRKVAKPIPVSSWAM